MNTFLAVRARFARKKITMKNYMCIFLMLMLFMTGYSQTQTKNYLYSDTTKNAMRNQLHDFFWNVLTKQKLKESYLGVANIRFRLNDDQRPVQVECSFGTPKVIQEHIKNFYDSVIRIDVFKGSMFQNHGDKFYVFLFNYNFYILGKPRLLAPDDIMQYECMNRFVSDFTEQERRNGIPDCSVPLPDCILLPPVKFDNSPKPIKRKNAKDGYNIKAKLRIANERNKPAI
jgi:hypothetical protein